MTKMIEQLEKEMVDLNAAMAQTIADDIEYSTHPKMRLLELHAKRKEVIEALKEAKKPKLAMLTGENGAELYRQCIPLYSARWNYDAAKGFAAVMSADRARALEMINAQFDRIYHAAKDNDSVHYWLTCFQKECSHILSVKP